jgi:hypothetical protein
MKHEFRKGDLVWWTMGVGTPLKFRADEPFVGIVTQVSEKAEGIEVYWFNNNVFKVINCEQLMKATLENSYD